MRSKAPRRKKFDVHPLKEKPGTGPGRIPRMGRAKGGKARGTRPDASLSLRSWLGKPNTSLPSQEVRHKLLTIIDLSIAIEMSPKDSTRDILKIRGETEHSPKPTDIGVI